MEIVSIKWNGRVLDTTHMGEKTGTKFSCSEVSISKKHYGGASEKHYISISKMGSNKYNITYRQYGKDYVLSVFNPIEVLTLVE